MFIKEHDQANGNGSTGDYQIGMLDEPKPKPEKPQWPQWLIDQHELHRRRQIKTDEICRPFIEARSKQSNYDL